VDCSPVVDQPLLHSSALQSTALRSIWWSKIPARSWHQQGIREYTSWIQKGVRVSLDCLSSSRGCGVGGWGVGG